VVCPAVYARSRTPTAVIVASQSLRAADTVGADHTDHKMQGSMIRRYIIRRNRHADDRRLRTVVNRANVA
jgi:hypothetical protein